MGKQQYTGAGTPNSPSSSASEYKGASLPDNQSSNEYKGAGTINNQTTEDTNGSIYGFSDVLGANMNYVESAYDAGHFNAEAFGKTDAASVNALKPVMSALEKEKGILKRYKMLQDQAQKGFTKQSELDKFNASLNTILGKEIIELDEKTGEPVINKKTGKPNMVRAGGILQDARMDVMNKWGEIANDFSHDPTSLVKDKYAYGWDSFEKKGKILTGAEYEKNYQGLIIQEGKDKQSNDALQKAIDELNFPAYQDLMSIDKQMVKATNGYRNTASDVSSNFTQRALSLLKSEDADERHAAHEWITDVVNELGKNDQNMKVIFVDQLKGLGFKAQTAMWSGNSKMIEKAFNKLDPLTKSTLVENAIENKYKVTEDNEYYPATADKSVADYQNALRVGKEFNKWSKELVDNEEDLYEKAFTRAKVSAIDDVFSNQPGDNPDFSIYDQIGIPEKVKIEAYKAAFDSRGRVKGNFDSWLKEMATRQFTNTTKLTGTWFGTGLGDKTTTETKSGLEWIGYNIDPQGLQTFKESPGQSAGGQFVSEMLLGPKMPRKEDLEKLYNKILTSQQAQYDEIKFNTEYTKSLVFGGLGNKSAATMTTIGLDGAIDPNSKSLINKSVPPKDETLLSKQNNFSKVMGIFEDNEGWIDGSQNNMANFAITNDINYAMNMSEFEKAGRNNSTKLDNFFSQKDGESSSDYKERMSNLQMSYLKYTSLPGYSMYKIYNPNTKKHIYATVNNKKLSEVKEDNYTYSRQNWIQETFNLDGVFELTNRKLPNGKNAFVGTPRLIHENRMYNLEYSYRDSKGNTQKSIVPFAPIGSMTVEEAQKRASEHLDILRSDMVNK